ncbi:hypothetical protein UlMin_017339 [Ulmus minor]
MENDVDFEWGNKLENSIRNKNIQFYESFTYRGANYCLYDCVCFYNTNHLETSVGKLVKIFETSKQEKKVLVVWFLRPIDIRDFLGDVAPCWNELFLASGQGVGLSNINLVEAIIGKYNVVCTSKDKRNPQASEEELKMADYIFYRTFDVGSHTISEKFPDEIRGIKVEFFFNRSKETKFTKPPKVIVKFKEVDDQCNVSSRLELQKSSSNPVKNVSAKIATRNESGCSPSENPTPIHFTNENETELGRLIKDKSKVRSHEEALPENLPDTRPPKKRMIPLGDKTSQNKRDLTKLERLCVRTSTNPQTSGALIASGGGVKTNGQLIEVTTRPDADRRLWFKPLPWEDRLQKAHRGFTLVLLDNLDPSYTSHLVEDLVWHALNEKVTARMKERCTFSNPLYGQAFVIFKTKDAADTAINELTRRCLIIEDGRCVIGRRTTLREPSKATSFVGHLVVDKIRPQKQREEMRNAVSTSHCAQRNTIEYDLAMQWLELQEKSDLWWKALFESHREIKKKKNQIHK